MNTEQSNQLNTESGIQFATVSSEPKPRGLRVSYYFQGRKDLFKGLAIDKLEKQWAEYPVFHISFSNGNFTDGKILRQILEDYIAEIETVYGKNPNANTPTYLVRLLAHSNENINELVGKYYDASQFIDYKADVEQPLPMIYQSGYLTIKDCNIEDNTYLLDFPNEEVRNGFIDTVASRYFANITQNTSWVLDVTDCLRKGDTAKFEEGQVHRA